MLFTTTALLLSLKIIAEDLVEFLDVPYQELDFQLGN
jgi:hypothetical protein